MATVTIVRLVGVIGARVKSPIWCSMVKPEASSSWLSVGSSRKRRRTLPAWRTVPSGVAVVSVMVTTPLATESMCQFMACVVSG